jgi:uncharacterized integral membrane protein
MRKYFIYIIILVIVLATLFTSCILRDTTEVDYIVAVKNNYWEIIITILGVIAGAIIGGSITFLVSSRIQRKEYETKYAIKSKEEIYEPLYNEISGTVKFLNSSNFSSYGIYLNSWDNLEESKKVSSPPDLTKFIKQFKEVGREYMVALHRVDIDLISKLIKQEINEIMEENKIAPQINLRIFLEKKKTEVLKKIKSDLLSGKILKNENNLMGILIGDITYKDFFERINPKISKRTEFITLREEKIRITEIAIKFEKYLKKKIDYISKKYGGKISKI